MSPDEGVQSAGAAARSRVKGAAAGNQTIYNIGGSMGVPGSASTTAQPKTQTGA